jgi:Phosphopantetheine attachment site
VITQERLTHADVSGQFSGPALIPARPPSDKAPMSADSGAALLGTIHESLSGLLADMMGSAAGRSAPAPHVSFFALGVREPEALELIQIVNTVFGLDLPADTVLRSPTPDSLARGIETAWFDADGSAADLAERIAALSYDE